MALGPDKMVAQRAGAGRQWAVESSQLADRRMAEQGGRQSNGKRGEREVPQGGEDGQRRGLAVQHVGGREKRWASGMGGWKQGREEEGERNCGGMGMAGRREGDSEVVLRRALRMAAGRRRMLPTVEAASK